VASKFWARVDRNGPIHPTLRTRCWLWSSSRWQSGYGRFKLKGKHHVAHRFAWYLKHGVYSTLCVLHRCDNPSCVRPSHLREGTNKENTEDMMRKGRHAGGKGETHGNAKLTDVEVLEIRKQAGGVSQAALARRFGVGQPQISKILSRKRRSCA
jgi:hypothetical protein